MQEINAKCGRCSKEGYAYLFGNPLCYYHYTLEKKRRLWGKERADWFKRKEKRK